MPVSLETKPPSLDCISAGRSLTKKRNRIGKLSMSARNSAVSLRKVRGNCVLGAEFCPSLVGGDTIEADLSSEGLGSAGVNSREPFLELAMLGSPQFIDSWRAVLRPPIAPCSKKIA